MVISVGFFVEENKETIKFWPTYLFIRMDLKFDLFLFFSAERRLWVA